MRVLRLTHSKKFHNTPQRQTSSPFVPHVLGTLNVGTHSDVARVSQMHRERASRFLSKRLDVIARYVAIQAVSLYKSLENEALNEHLAHRDSCDLYPRLSRGNSEVDMNLRPRWPCLAVPPVVALSSTAPC